MKLGKRAPSNRPAVAFGAFLTSIPAHPIVDAAPSYSYPMDDNDRIGDCVVAAFDHSKQVISGLLTGTQQNLTDAQIIALYKTQNPDFDPNGSASTNGPGSLADAGMDIQTFLEHLVSTGDILAFGKIDHTNEEELKAAIYLGLSVMTGVQLQQAQMNSFGTGKWDYVAGSPTIGGHCIPLAGYTNSPDGETAISWGAEVTCTKAFVTHTMEEAWFILLPEHVAHLSYWAPFFDYPGYKASVSQITGGKVIIPDAPAPAPAPNAPFSKDLHFDMTDPDVMRLQQRLAAETASDGHPCYRYEVAGALYFGNYFGVNTREAVVRYQDAHGITPDQGYLGPITRAALNQAPMTYDFSSQKAAYHSTRLICDDVGLSLDRSVEVNGVFYQPKDILCACLYQESNFMNRYPDGTPVEHQNKDASGKVSSTDWGVAQVNDYWNIGQGKPFSSVEYVLDNPDEVVRWMADTIKKTGQLAPWSSYSTGAYEKWLVPTSPMWLLKS